MRPLPLCLAAALAVACTREQSRPAKEAVAEAKGAATDAAKAAQLAAAQAKQGAATAAAEAQRATNAAGQAVEQGVASAGERARDGVQAVTRGVAELGQGGVVTGKVQALSPSRLELASDGQGPLQLRVDSRTQYVLHGERGQTPHLLAGDRVRATYVVEAQVPVATQVEVLTR